MSTTANTSRKDARAAVPSAGTGKVSWAGVLHSEWIKLTSLRSTLILILSSVVVIVGIAMIVAVGVGMTQDMMAETPEMAAQMGGPAGMEEMVGSIAGAGVSIATLIMGALAVMLISSEFATGSARSTFTAVPKRQPVFWAKALLIMVVAFVVTVAATLLAYLAIGPILSGSGVGQSLTNPVFVRTLWIGALGVAMVAALGFSFGALLRNSAGGIMTLVGIVFVLPSIVMAIPLEWVNKLGNYLPTSAISNLTTPAMMGGNMETWQAVTAVAGWMIIPLAAAAFVLQRRDI